MIHDSDIEEMAGQVADNIRMSIFGKERVLHYVEEGRICTIDANEFERFVVGKVKPGFKDLLESAIEKFRSQIADEQNIKAENEKAKNTSNSRNLIPVEVRLQKISDILRGRNEIYGFEIDMVKSEINNIIKYNEEVKLKFLYPHSVNKMYRITYSYNVDKGLHIENIRSRNHYLAIEEFRSKLGLRNPSVKVDVIIHSVQCFDLNRD